MEQSNQQIIQKPSLPIKTKIAAWWMIIVIGGPLILYFGLGFAQQEMPGASLFGIMLICFGIFFLYSSISLLKRKKWGWDTSVTLLYILIGLLIYAFYEHPQLAIEPFILAVVFFLPLILLLLDRKNFWKIAI